jgi:hypothetical protein
MDRRKFLATTAMAAAATRIPVTNNKWVRRARIFIREHDVFVEIRLRSDRAMFYQTFRSNTADRVDYLLDFFLNEPAPHIGSFEGFDECVEDARKTHKPDYVDLPEAIHG